MNKIKKTKNINEDNIIVKVCTLCEKPHKLKTHLCFKCNKKSKDLSISIHKLITLKKIYKVNDVFNLLEEKPFLLKAKVERNESLELKRNLRKKYRSDEYRNSEYKKTDNKIPDYILYEMKKYPSKKFISLSGENLNPTINYMCLVCLEEQISKFSDLSKAHNCTHIKSTGEAIIENFLIEQGIEFKTQFDTLKCINPLNNRQLPYDIEITNKKILIEIQGEQHLKFIEFFHGTKENFKYQVRKDSYKKRYAEKKGYKIIYIYYNEFLNDIYKKKILDIMNN